MTELKFTADKKSAVHSSKPNDSTDTKQEFCIMTDARTSAQIQNRSFA